MYNEGRISCCIDMMFAYTDFYSRFEAVKNCGINAVEFWKWSDKDIDRVSELSKKNGLTVSVFNLDSRDKKLSYDLSRGIINAGRKEEFVKALEESMPVYHKLNARAMIVLIGENREYSEQNSYQCLKAARPILEKENINLIIEPLNNIDRKGYSMPYAKPVFKLLRRINSPHIKMLYDIYHQNMMKDFSVTDIKNNIDIIGHFHVADTNGRHEPGTGNVDFGNILKEISSLDYKGYVGLEYRATKRDEKTLDFLKEE